MLEAMRGQMPSISYVADSYDQKPTHEQFISSSSPAMLWADKHPDFQNNFEYHETCRLYGFFEFQCFTGFTSSGDNPQQNVALAAPPPNRASKTM